MSDQGDAHKEGSDLQHLDTHLSDSTSLSNQDPSLSTTIGGSRVDNAQTQGNTVNTTSRTSRSHNKASSSSSAGSTGIVTRRSARISNAGLTDQAEAATSSVETQTKGEKRKYKASPQEEIPSPSIHKHSPLKSSPLCQETTTDRKGKKRAIKSPTPPPNHSSSAEDHKPSVPKRARKSISTESRYSLRKRSNDDNATPTAGSSKKKASDQETSAAKKTKGNKEMSKKVNNRPKRAGYATPTAGAKKGDTSTKQLIDDPMDDEDDWMDEPETSRSRFGAPEDSHDDDMEGSDHEGDEDASDDGMDGGLGGPGGGMSELARHARESGLLDEATAAALFGGGGFRAFGGMMSGLSNRFRRLRNELRSRSTTTRLAALRECSELLLVSNEDTLGGSFSTHQFAAEFIAILKGQPNIDDKADAAATPRQPEDMDEDAQLAAALAMSTGGGLPPGFGSDDDDEMECQLVACRCLAHLLEALPGSGHTLVHLGAVPALCSKLQEITYIELAEQTLSTLEKISSESPSAIVKEGGLAALLNFLPFFSTNVQRTAVTAAANCCRNISSEHFAQIRDAFPILRDVLTQADQRLVEQATLAVVRTIESYKHNASHLEGLLDVPTVVAVNSLLNPSGGSPLLTPSTCTHLLRALTTSARGSAKVAIAFLEAGMTNTVYQILTGVLPPAHDDDEQGGAEGGQGLAGGIADMAVLQNLAHRPKDQVEESLALICELLPPLPRDGVFDPRSYTEKSLARIKKGRKTEKSDRPARRSTRNAEASVTPSTAGPGTPTAGASDLPAVDTTVLTPAALAKENATKLKKEQEIQQEQRTDYFNAHPELLAKFIKAILPVLVDVYAASVAMRVRTKVLNALLRAVAFSGPDGLRATLKSVPMASFLCAIISSKDHAAFVLPALQLVELLAVKLPDVYQLSFQREGVVFEIEALATQELTTAKTAEKNPDEVDVKQEPDTSSPVAGSSSGPAASAIPDDLKPVLEAAGLTGMSSFLMDLGVVGVAPSTPRKSSLAIDLNDANILRARCLLAKKIFSSGSEDSNIASSVLDDINALVKRLCVPEATEGEIRDTLREITKQFTNPGQSLSSFELLKSGLVDGLLEFVDIDGTVASHERRDMLHDVFSDTTLSSPSPLTSLVKRLHESLGRLEEFQVETAFNGAPDVNNRNGTPALSRTIRVRLQAEEGQDIPKHASAMSVSIQAIAPLQALHDYLRPRVADVNYLSGGGLSSMFAAFASGMPLGAGSNLGRVSRLLDAMNNASSGGAPPGLPTSASAQDSSRPKSPAQATGAPAETPAPPVRRRSARLSGAGLSESADPVTPAPQVASSASIPIPGGLGASDSTHLSISPEAPIFPSMPMDMDFDDEEGFSDDDYDVEAFEDEMEEELNRPQEKVVNMSVAPDGSRVEAKTPDGTRIATPSQAAAQSAPGPSGSGTPRTGSYAGAVKATPNDFHLVFTHNGQPVSLDNTIYGAIHKYGDNSSGTNNTLAYGNLAVFKFRKVDGPPPEKPAVDAPSPASVASAMPTALDPHSPTSKILRLLRVVHNLSVDAANSNLDENVFVNNKLTAKLTRQLEETMIIASDCLPDWAVELPKHFSFLFPFETRYSFLQSTSFGYGRLLAKSQANSNNRGNRNRDDLSHLARIVRQKVRISRSQLLESCAKVLELYGTQTGILEVEYFDEIGTGLGPTLEFYSIASKEFARKSLSLWRDEDETKEGNYVFHPRGLYPAPVKPNEDSNAKLGWYKTLGLFTGRALLDSRIIDVNLNNIFLKLILGRPVKRTIANLKLVDPGLARSLERLQVYLQTRKEIEALKLPPGGRRNKLMQLTVSGAKLADLSLDFTLPGYDIELKPGGKHIDVDDHNLEEYLELVLDMTLGSGIARQVKAFRDGFSNIFSIEDMTVFSPEEVGLLFGNAEEDWSKETLEHAIKADHGYNLDSRSVQNLVEVMSSYSKDERRQFLQFITGAPKLPIGGFRGLNPPFTVVRKPHEPPFRADDYLPSVMTCAQYLKLPDYSSKEVLASQISRAMLDGGGSFHLS